MIKTNKSPIAALLFLLSLFLAASVHGEGVTQPVTIEQQLLDGKMKVLDAETRLVEVKIRNQREEHKQFMESENKLYTYTTLGVIAGVAFGWLSFLIMAHKWVRGWVEKEIENNLKHLTRIVDNSRMETRFKEDIRLLVLFRPGHNNNLDFILRNSGFLVADAQPCPSLPGGINWKEYDQVIFDDLEESTVIEYINYDPNRWYFAYKPVGRYEQLPAGSKLALANTKMTLYPRLMELLTWKHWQQEV